MNLMDTLHLLTLWDLVAVAFMLIVWQALGWWIEHPTAKHPSVTILMAQYRRDWMDQFVTRQPRIFDAQIISGLRQVTSFFASTCLLAIGGVLALVGNTDPLRGVAENVAQDAVPVLIWQIKLLLVAFFLANGFLKFVWSNRVFGYCSVMMAAVPNDADNPLAYPRARQAAELNIRAAVNFNRGLRAMYFALGAMAWLIGPLALFIAALITIWLVWSREFASVPRKIVLDHTKL